MREKDFFGMVRKWFVFVSIVVIVLSLCVLKATDVSATENGGSAYPNGVEDFMSGALPPPGTYFIDYISYYHANDFKDSNGDTLIPDFDLKVTANTFRFVHVTNKNPG